MAQKKKSGSTAKTVGIGVGLTAAAAAAASAYFLYGSKNAPKNRKMVKGWMKQAKTEVMKALENAGDITEKEYNALIESVGGIYSTFASATKGDIADFKKEMQSHWKEIEKSNMMKKAKKAVVKTVKDKMKPAKKTSKKASKKSTKKKA